MWPWEAAFSPPSPLLAREETEFRKTKKQNKGRRRRKKLEEARNKISKRTQSLVDRGFEETKRWFLQVEKHRHFLLCVDFRVVLESWKPSRCQAMSLLISPIIFLCKSRFSVNQKTASLSRQTPLIIWCVRDALPDTSVLWGAQRGAGSLPQIALNQRSQTKL